MALIEIDWKPDRRKLRGFGVICLVAFGAIGTWIYFREHIFGFDVAPPTAAKLGCVLWTLAGLCGLLGAAAPAALRPLYVALTAATLPIGYVLSHVMMGALFYLVVTPIGLVLRLMGRDAMCRRFEPKARTYWVRREAVTDMKRYYKQF
jgi:hypothetical protein